MTALSGLPRLVQELPSQVRALASSWPSLVGSVRGLTEELEKDFRFGRCVIRLAGGYRLGGHVKGGTSTLWYPSSRAEFRAYCRWKKVEGVPRKRNRRAFRQLLGLCEENGIELRTADGASGPAMEVRHPRFGAIFEIFHSVLCVLPASHLRRPELRGIQIGGWGPDAAKGSAYEEGWVLMYDFATDGAIRTLVGLFLHELGHAQERSFGPTERSRLECAFRELAVSGSFLGAEFLLDAQTRRILQQFAFAEFLAETYLLFVSQGARLRTYFRSLEERDRRSWETVYEIFCHAFEGTEYA